MRRRQAAVVDRDNITGSWYKRRFRARSFLPWTIVGSPVVIGRRERREVAEKKKKKIKRG